MPVYLAIPLSTNPEPLDLAVDKYIHNESDKHRLQANRGWLIRYDGTTVELSNHLTLTGQPKGEKSPVGSALIVPVTSYFGRGPTDMWEWIKTRMEK